MCSDSRVSPLSEEVMQAKRFFYEHFEARGKRFLGKILTQIDASIVDERQNKALKDLIKSECNEFMWELQDYASDNPGIPNGARWAHSVNLDDIN